MKTRLLIIIGIVIAFAISLSYYVTHDSSTIVFIDCDSWSEQIGDQCVLLKPEQYCADWCNYQELSDLGCGGPVLDYIYRHTNLFDEKFDNTFYYRNAIGLPDGVSEEKFEWCVDFIYEKRFPSNDVKSEKLKLEVESESISDMDFSEININCMTLEQSKTIAPFFKVPSYLPEGYSMKCSRSGMPYESYVIYHNKEVSDGWIGKIHILIDDGAIFILQTDERNFVGAEKFETFGTAEQRIQETYDSVIELNPALQPQLIRINGMLAYAVDSCSDCGKQTANFSDGTVLKESTSTKTRIKFIDENGINYMLETILPLDELILVAESLQ